MSWTSNTSTTAAKRPDALVTTTGPQKAASGPRGAAAFVFAGGGYDHDSPAPCPTCGAPMSLVAFVADSKTWRCTAPHQPKEKRCA